MSTNSHIKRIFVILRQFFSLGENKENESDIISSIRKGVEFKGTNLWILVFAIILASIGLNVNSTAIIIGAMLISPLMGPIMGIGLGVGIYDFELIKKAGRNLLVAVLISIAASSLYFLLSPLTEAQSELLARTTPTIWDVFIALFGGLAGIIAGSSKEKGNVIPGVAIATALMPPLCTAGYGIANGDMLFFLGAIYLFFINSVFICLATYITVRFLKFHHKEFVNPKREMIIKRYIYLIIVVTIIPSIYLAYRIVDRSIFEQNARRFIQNELSFNETQIISKSYKQDANNKTIDITLIGKTVDSILINHAKDKLSNYNLTGTNLIIRQGSYGNRNDITSIKSEIIEELFQKNDLLIKSKEEKIKFLENELAKLEKAKLPIKDITNEALAVQKNISEFSINNGIIYNAKNNKYDTVFIAYLSFVRIPSDQEIESLNRWLKARIKSDKIKLIIKSI